MGKPVFYRHYCERLDGDAVVTVVWYAQAELSMAQAQRQASGASEMMSGWRQRAAQATLRTVMLRRGHLTDRQVPWARHVWAVWAAHAMGARAGRGRSVGRRGLSEARSDVSREEWLQREVGTMDLTVALRREVRPLLLASHLSFFHFGRALGSLNP